mmetsp:Transcript_13474/g.29722  ORF Transcript_13474/g.29722 Transcript_13474/m.29722 type:complete len:385 (-) Transcript_13474:152-1306(-)
MAEEADDVQWPHGGAGTFMSTAASLNSHLSNVSGNGACMQSQGLVSEASSNPGNYDDCCRSRVAAPGQPTWRSNCSVDTARLDDIVASEGVFESTGMLLVYAAEGQGEESKDINESEGGAVVGAQPGLSQEKVMTPVSLNVYDLSKSSLVGFWNRTAAGLGVGGAFHVGVEIFDQEWSYGWTQTGSGIACCPPYRHPNHVFLVSVPLGQICCSRLELLSALRSMGSWSGTDYNVIHHNCIHFAEALVDHLGVGPLPRWVATLSKHMEAVTSPIKRLCGVTLLRPAAIEHRSLTDQGLETLDIGSGSKSSSGTGTGTGAGTRTATATTAATTPTTSGEERPSTAASFDATSLAKYSPATSFGLTRKGPKPRRSTTTPTATTCAVQ